MTREEGALLERLARQLERAEDKARRRGQAEDWHKLRTTSRKLRGALIAHAPGLDAHLHRWLARRAKKITKLPTEVRDLDVAMDNLRALADGAERKGERRAARALARRLKEKRRQSERAIRKRLKRDEPVAALASVLHKAVRRGTHPHASNGATASPPSGNALEACAQVVLERQAEVRGWQDGNRLHELRVAVKKYRGALEATHPGETAVIESLQKLQQVLGEHHDWSELARRLGERAARLGRRTGKKKVARRAALVALRTRARAEQRRRYEIYLDEHADRLAALVAGRGDRVVAPMPMAETALRGPVSLRN